MVSEFLTSEGRFRALRELCAVDSTTGVEDRLLPVLHAQLAGLGLKVELIEVAPGRHNVLAWRGTPKLLFSTHCDTVPPFIAPHLKGDTLYGRGTCDAKGQMVAQFAAIAALAQRGMHDVAWLGVVGEETDSLGAKHAELTLRGRFPQLRAVFNGEPTHNVLGSGQRGVRILQLTCKGEPAHSGTPELGRSAIWPLLDWVQALRMEERPADAELGPEVWNLGQISGGCAPNIVPEHAAAVLLLRELPDSNFTELVQAHKPECGQVQQLNHTPAARFPEVPGFPRAMVSFGSDAPRVRALVPSRTVVLAGPGAIEVAHTAHEHLTRADLDAGVALLLRLSEHFWEQPL
ncbi:MAG: M20/M25/M40 family metallo-hydrolase [Planctomycetes bacterium]|nr:M20/M25/M40 family metallo-hydrolase [Planctomycetota bacterium]